MILEGKLVRFRLSPEGETALKGLFEKPTISALVECVDALGAWIHYGSKKRVGVGQKKSDVAQVALFFNCVSRLQAWASSNRIQEPGEQEKNGER